ncbi:hypothetical protein ASF44_14660 [Pseudorhodoferax sp. Leaf274]|nr:hypothetical protein ASF44_14660 [Pseudorhodoferax sp. Leaf274]
MSHHATPTIIALAGYAGAGKDSAADILVKHAGFHKIAFADALRGEVARGFNVSRDLLEDRSKKELPQAALALRYAPAEFLGSLLRTEHGNLHLDEPRTPRTILQLWGTEYRRSQHPEYWVRQMTAELRTRAMWGLRRFVITDCRFANEAAYVRRAAGLVWQIARPGLNAGTTPEGQHQSAADGSGFAPEVVLHNFGTLADLRDRVLSAWWSHEAGASVTAVVAGATA